MYLYMCNVYMCVFTYVYIYIHTYIHAYGCMYVCVWNIWRDVKLLPVAVAVHRFFIFHFFNTYGYCVFQTLVSCQVVSHSRGAQKAHRAVPNEALYGVLRISRLITWTYLHSFWNNFAVNFPTFVSGDRLNPEPACRSFPVLKFSHFYCTVVAICMSHLTFEGSTSNLLHLAMVLAMVTFRYFSGLFTDPFLSGITGVFLQVRCIPHQNSQRLFWASVCVYVWIVCRSVNAKHLNAFPLHLSLTLETAFLCCVFASWRRCLVVALVPMAGFLALPKILALHRTSWWVEGESAAVTKTLVDCLLLKERCIYMYIYIYYIYIYIYVIYIIIYIDYLVELGWWNWYYFGTQKYCGTQNYLWTSWKLRDRCWKL